MEICQLSDHPEFTDVIKRMLEAIAADYPHMLESRLSCAANRVDSGDQYAAHDMFVHSAIYDAADRFSWSVRQTKIIEDISNCVIIKRDAKHREGRIAVGSVGPEFTKAVAERMKAETKDYAIKLRYYKKCTTVIGSASAAGRKISIGLEMPNLVGIDVGIMIVLQSGDRAFHFDVSRLCGCIVLRFRKLDEAEARFLTGLFAVLTSAGLSFLSGIAI